MKGCAGAVWFVLAWLPVVAGAETPEWKARLTRLPPGNFAMPESCELVYHLSWSNVLKAGEARIRFYSRGQDGRTPGEIYARAETRSAGLARALWPYDAKTETWVARDRLLPLRVAQEEEDRQERNIYRTSFGPSRVENEWTTVDKRQGSAPVVRRRTYDQTDPPIHDLMSAMLFLRSLPFDELNQPVSVVCYPFRDSYLVTATPRGKEFVEVQGRPMAARKFEITLAKIERDLSLKIYDEKMKSAHFWISDDAQRIPVGLKAELFVGSIIVSLKEYREPAGGAMTRSAAASLVPLAREPELGRRIPARKRVRP